MKIMPITMKEPTILIKIYNDIKLKLTSVWETVLHKQNINRDAIGPKNKSKIY